MKLSSYLSRSRHGVYYFRWPIPDQGKGHRRCIRTSLRTKCPDRAGAIARYLASSGILFKDNKDLARLRQDQIRELVGTYFKAQLEQYLEWHNNRGFTANAMEDMRWERTYHELAVEDGKPYLPYLPQARFQRKMGVSDMDWSDSQPRIDLELHRGRRDMLTAALDAAEGATDYPFVNTSQAVSATPESLSSPLGGAIDDFMSEHSRQWPDKTTNQVRAYLGILIEFFGPDRLLGDITKKDASDVKKLLLQLPVSRNTKPALKAMTLQEVIKVANQRCISPKTINSHIDTFRRFFDWAERHDLAPHKLFVGMKVPNLPLRSVGPIWAHAC